METNQLGKSIVKASIILASALVISVIIYAASKDRYTPLGDMRGYYIDQRTGIVNENDNNAKR